MVWTGHPFQIESLIIGIIGIIIGIKFISVEFRLIRSSVFTSFKIIFLIALMVYVSWMILNTIYYIAYAWYPMARIVLITEIICNVLYTMLLSLCMMSWYIRLKYIFIGTFLQPSTFYLNVQAILILVTILCGFIGGIIWAFDRDTGLLFIGVSLLVYLIVSGSILYKFVAKLKKLNQETIDLKGNKDNLNKLTLKYTILGFIQYTSTLIWLVTLILLTIFIEEEWSWIIYIASHNIDSIINMLCLYLQYDIGKNDYNTLCFYCDKHMSNKSHEASSLEMNPSSPTSIESV